LEGTGRISCHWWSLLIIIAIKLLLVWLHIKYGRKCRTPIYWDEVVERKLLGLEMVQLTTDKVRVIRKRMKDDVNLVITWSRNPHAKTSIPGKPSKSGLIGV
jgi:hypothetical protein